MARQSRAVYLRSAGSADDEALATIASGENPDGTAFSTAVTATPSTTGTLANVASSATVVTLQALNTSRLGWTVWNDSTSVLYLKFGSGASATSCTVKIAADGYYELPFLYTGVITGIWASANGNARVTEFV